MIAQQHSQNNNDKDKALDLVEEALDGFASSKEFADFVNFRGEGTPEAYQAACSAADSKERLMWDDLKAKGFHFKSGREKEMRWHRGLPAEGAGLSKAY